jgi:hypothetical protein
MKLITTLFVAAATASAQCVMCRTVAAAQSGAASHAMDKAIVVLLGPAVALFCGIFVTIFRNMPKDE